MARSLHLLFAAGEKPQRRRLEMRILATATKIFASVLLFFVISINAQSVYELPTGTKIKLRMDNEINSKVSRIDDTFTAVVAEPVAVRDVVVLPVGAVIEGRITQVKPASNGGKSGEMDVEFKLLRLKGDVKRDIAGKLTNPLEAAKISSTVKALTIIGGTAIGALIGGVAKSGTGAAVGAAIGAGAGTGAVYLQKGREVRIKADEMFEIELSKSVTLPTEDY